MCFVLLYELFLFNVCLWKKFTCVNMEMDALCLMISGQSILILINI